MQNAFKVNASDYYYPQNCCDINSKTNLIILYSWKNKMCVIFWIIDKNNIRYQVLIHFRTQNGSTKLSVEIDQYK